VLSPVTTAGATGRCLSAEVGGKVVMGRAVCSEGDQHDVAEHHFEL
jgi:hypothetical protein